MDFRSLIPSFNVKRKHGSFKNIKNQFLKLEFNTSERYFRWLPISTGNNLIIAFLSSLSMRNGSRYFSSVFARTLWPLWLLGGDPRRSDDTRDTGDCPFSGNTPWYTFRGNLQCGQGEIQFEHGNISVD